MNQLVNFLIHAAFSLMFMNGVLTLYGYYKHSENRKKPTMLLYSALNFCSCGYLLTESFGPQAHYSFFWWVEFLSGNALTGMFWLVSVCFFSDNSKLQAWRYYLASMTLFIPLLSLLSQLAFNFELKDFPPLWGLVTYVALLLELSLVIHALIVAIRNWPSDLVQSRRNIRAGVITFTAIYIVSVIVFEQLLDINWIWLDIFKYTVLTSLIVITNTQLFTLKDNSFFEDPQQLPIQIKAKKAQSPELQRVIDCMINDKFYQQEGVTIRSLAKHLAMHEYKLRQLINGELGFRNFNEFLNYYRIKEVAEKLANPDHHHLPVLTLALDSGFRSLSSFNKAFKNTYSVTPTEYRNKS